MSDILTDRVRVPSLVDVVTERLEAAIMNGQLPPGTKISEQSLAQSLGVSRGPLREAIRRLEGRKLIERTPNVGVRIAMLDAAELDELLDVREALEGMACRLAAKNMSDEEIAALQALVEEHGQQEDVQEDSGYYQEPRTFDLHFRIARGSGNGRLFTMLCGDLYDLFRLYRYKSSKKRGRTQRALAEHRAIVAAIAARDADLAERLMREHLQHGRAHPGGSWQDAGEPDDG